MPEFYSITEDSKEIEIAADLRLAAGIWNHKPERRRVYLVKPVEDGPGTTAIREIPRSELQQLAPPKQPDFWIKGSAPRWVVGHLPSGLLMDVCRDPWRCEVAVEIPGRELTPSDTEKIKLQAIDRVRSGIV